MGSGGSTPQTRRSARGAGALGKASMLDKAARRDAVRSHREKGWAGELNKEQEALRLEREKREKKLAQQAESGETFETILQRRRSMLKSIIREQQYSQSESDSDEDDHEAVDDDGGLYMMENVSVNSTDSGASDLLQELYGSAGSDPADFDPADSTGSSEGSSYSNDSYETESDSSGSSQSSNASEDPDPWVRPVYIPLSAEEKMVVRSTRKVRQLEKDTYVSQMAQKGRIKAETRRIVDLRDDSSSGCDDEDDEEPQPLQRKRSVKFTEAVVVDVVKRKLPG